MKLTSLVSVLFFLQLLGCVSAFSRVKREDLIEDRLVDNKSLTLGADSVRAINSRTTLFTARRYPRFENLSNEELKSFLGTKSNAESLAAAASFRQKRQIEDIDHDDQNTLVTTVPPASFDISEQWPQCKKVFEAIQDQSNCGSCWAVSTSSVMSDRRCIRYNGTAGARISAWDVTSCCDYCQVKPGNGCKGGYTYYAMWYYQTIGVVTGGPYNGGGCKPYPIVPGTTSQTWSTSCSQTCQPSYSINAYPDDHKKGLYANYIQLNNTAVQQEILARGSVVAQFAVYQDFYQYWSGIYQHTTGSLVDYHSVKIHGWGEENGVKYWKVANSWGASWGENGFFRIRRDTNECGFEEFIVFARALKD